MARERVLLCLVGMSPAVLTETVWALALVHGWVPDRVVVLTTEVGKRKVLTEVVQGGVWTRLCAALGKQGVETGALADFGEADVVCFSHRGAYLEDLTTEEENLAAADALLGEVRKWTETAETEVVASIAGGRKTMGALLLSCMSLLGRGQDRVCHVLVSPPFDGGVEPSFYFPEPGGTYVARKGAAAGQALPAEAAQVQCFFVPYVRMREAYAEHFRQRPPSYRRLVEAVEQAVAKVPEVALDLASGRLTVNGQTLQVAATEFAVALGLWHGKVDPGELHQEIYALHQLGGAEKQATWLAKLSESSRFSQELSSANTEDVSKTMSALRESLRGVLPATVVAGLLPTRGKAATVQPKVTVRGLPQAWRGKHPWLTEGK
ncbi:MAG: CRISPR-associated ring nuclease Csm6 [Candidatus Spyradenecus sp.]